MRRKKDLTQGVQESEVISLCLDQLPERYRLGDDTLDGQHEILFQLLSELTTLCQEGRQGVELSLILLSLRTYVTVHFRYEEEYMASVGYPGRDDHLLLHTQLEQKVLDALERFSTLSEPQELLNFAAELKEFLTQWLEQHIGKEDRDIVWRV